MRHPTLFELDKAFRVFVLGGFALIQCVWETNVLVPFQQTNHRDSIRGFSPGVFIIQPLLGDLIQVIQSALSSPSWRSLNPLKGSLNHPKKVTFNHQDLNYSWNMQPEDTCHWEQLVRVELNLTQQKHSLKRKDSRSVCFCL